MSEQGKSSIGINNDTAAKAAAWLLANFYFDLRGYQPCELVENWLNSYPGNWLRLAVIEALYQGRYKAISVEQILTIWHRRNQPLYHFNYEFETLICSKLPQELTQLFSPGVSNTTASTTSFSEFSEPQPSNLDDELEAPEKSAPISHPFEAFAQSSPPATKPSLPPIETQGTQPELPAINFESETSQPMPIQTSNLDEDYQVMNTEEENTASSYVYSDRFSNAYPFPDLFTKLKALALQHQELINEQER
jgi:hypothetical protein